MITGGIGQVDMAAIKDTAARIASVASDEFEASPSEELLSKVVKVAVDSLERSGNVDAESVRTALEAARSEFVKAGFSQRAFATKFSPRGKISGIKRFSTDSTEFAKARMENGKAIARAAKQLMSMPLTESGPKLAGALKNEGKGKWGRTELVGVFAILLENNSPLVSHPKFRGLLTRDENLLANQITREANGNIAYRTVDFDVDGMDDAEFWSRINKSPYSAQINENAAIALVRNAEKLGILS